MTKNEYTLRPYQKETVEAIVRTVEGNLVGGSIVSLPTASGKSLVIAEAANRLGVDILVVCPSREILSQNKEKLLSYVEKTDIGVFSASLNEKTIKKFTFCTLGSVSRRPELFSHFGLIIIDECDLIPTDKGMFITFVRKLKNLTGTIPTIIGLTATPFRNVSTNKYFGRHLMVSTQIQMLTNLAPQLWKRIIYNVDNWELVKAGYIVPLKVIKSIPLLPFEEIKQSSGDFALKDYSWRTKKSEERILWEIRQARLVYKSVLVFCSSVEQSERLSANFTHAAVVTAKTPPKERTQMIDNFKSGAISTIFNMGVLTCGFDHPALDCIILIRPTKSVRLFYQMSGRAVRTSPGKLYGTLIDLTGTADHIGRIESIKIREVDGAWHLFTSQGQMDNKILYSFEKEF